MARLYFAVLFAAMVCSQHVDAASRLQPRPSSASVNAINVIAPYKHHGMWVFDDARVGLAQEPFVSGADTMIDRAVDGLPDAEHGFVLLFSSWPFPGHQLELHWRRAES